MGQGRWDYECAVIGGGPGGLVAAMYLRRFRRSVILFDSGIPRAFWIPKTHNLIGFDRGITGKGLLKRLNHQVNELNVERIRKEAHLKKIPDGFEIFAAGHRLKVPKVILATGIQDVQPSLSNLTSLRSQGLLRYCSICDGFEFRNSTIAVLTRDNAGVEKALFIARYARKLKIFTLEDFNVSTKWLKQIRKIGASLEQGRLVAIEPARSGKGMFVRLEGQKPSFAHVGYVALGSCVQDTAFQNLRNLKRTKEGYLIATTEQRLSIPGLFGVGDCINLLGQLSVAAGQAAVAATTLHNDLL